jgi:hypothetical protein
MFIKILFGARFSVATVQLSRRIALPFWGQVFSHQGSTLSSNRVAFLGPGFRPPRFRFIVESPSAGKQKFPYQKILFFQKIVFLGTINPFIPQIRCTNGWYEDFRSPALGFWGQVFGRHGSVFSRHGST